MCSPRSQTSCGTQFPNVPTAGVVKFPLLVNHWTPFVPAIGVFIIAGSELQSAREPRENVPDSSPTDKTGRGKPVRKETIGLTSQPPMTAFTTLLSPPNLLPLPKGS